MINIDNSKPTPKIVRQIDKSNNKQQNKNVLEYSSENSFASHETQSFVSVSAFFALNANCMCKYFLNKANRQMIAICFVDGSIFRSARKFDTWIEKCFRAIYWPSFLLFFFVTEAFNCSLSPAEFYKYIYFAYFMKFWKLRMHKMCMCVCVCLGIVGVCAVCIYVGDRPE